jgi:2-polyprenyl-3-methyl-5-hydroxy-6-metoxy-1,4-benzoquinol methylase
MRRSTAKEMMDSQDNPRELLQDDLRNLRIINRYLGNHRSILRGVARAVSEHKLKDFSLLDVGTGSADIPVAIVEWARLRGLSAKIVALDSEPVTLETAADQTRDYAEIALLRCDGMALPFAAASFDFVLSSQVLHHFTEDGVIQLLRGWAQVARRALILSDLVRHPIAYYGIRLLTRVFTRNIMTRTDGPLSVQRAFTLDEWRELFGRAGIGPFRMIPSFPFRHLTLISLAH